MKQTKKQILVNIGKKRYLINVIIYIMYYLKKSYLIIKLLFYTNNFLIENFIKKLYKKFFFKLIIYVLLGARLLMFVCDLFVCLFVCNLHPALSE